MLKIVITVALRYKEKGAFAIKGFLLMGIRNKTAMGVATFQKNLPPFTFRTDTFCPEDGGMRLL